CLRRWRADKMTETMIEKVKRYMGGRWLIPYSERRLYEEIQRFSKFASEYERMTPAGRERCRKAGEVSFQQRERVEAAEYVMSEIGSVHNFHLWFDLKFIHA